MSEAGGLKSFLGLLRKMLLVVGRKACSLPAPISRALKLVALVVVFAVVSWQLHSAMRPYSPALVLKTTDLKETIIATPIAQGEKQASFVNGTADSPQFPSKYVMDCNPDIGRLVTIRDRHKLDDHIEYFKRHVRFSRRPIERQSYTTLQQSLIPAGTKDNGFERIRLSESYERKDNCRQPLEVSVPQSSFPGDADLSDFIFAISTTFKRLKNPATIKEWAFWLTDGNGSSNGGKLLVRLSDATELQLRDVAQRLADAGIDAEVGAWDSRLAGPMAARYFSLAPLLYKTAPTRKWFVLCDDDTFFTAINSLVKEFKRFDYTKPLYIGTLTEDMHAVDVYGSHAYSGAGVFLSRALAKTVFGVAETCHTPAKIKQSHTGFGSQGGSQGDVLLRQCIYENTDVRLTTLRDIWQLDLQGDASGFYEGGFKPYSVHHFKGASSGHLAYPLNSTKIAYTCGDDCPYQRFVTTDNFVISNGYSVAQYPDGIDFNLEQVERTFHSVDKDKPQIFDLVFGPQRPSLSGTGKKVAWELRESNNNMEDGSVSQVYIRKKNDERWTTKEGRPMKALDGVIELVWIPE